MKVDARHHMGWGVRLRFGLRLLGLTGLFAAGVGGLLLGPRLPDWKLATLESASHGGFGQTPMVGAYLLFLGMAAALLVVVVELFAGLFGSGRRSAASVNATVQTVLAVGILIAINYLAFQYPKRWDLTRDKEFTLSKPVTDELKTLKGRTTIIVLQQHKTFGQLSVKPDIYDYAAERKVVEKVRDLVDQFREIGPQFRVVSLDVEAIGYDKLLDEETKTRPGLKEAIAAAPENSIFFYADDRVETLNSTEAARRIADGRRLATNAFGEQVLAFEGNIPRMSFNEFYQLDKTASKESGGKDHGNLVLRPQGIEAFAKRVIAIQEKKPKVALMTIHEVLSTRKRGKQSSGIQAHGVRTSLEQHGFDVTDVLLMKWGQEGPSPTAYNLEETEFDRLAAELGNAEDQLRSYREDELQATAFRQMFKTLSLEDLNKQYRPRLRQDVTEEFRQRQLRAVDNALKQIAERTAELEVQRQETEAKVTALAGKERAFEDRRVTDIKAKMTRLVADCDLLIIPRHTLINSVESQSIPPTLYRMSADQIAVVKEFMAAGKPVLACMGPNVSARAPLGPEPLDDFERLLADLGLDLGRQTVLFDTEAKGYAALLADDSLGGDLTEVPPVSFPPPAAGKAPNPIAKAMQAIADSAGQSLEIRVRHPRPIYVNPELAAKMPATPDFLQTAAAAWNEESPLPRMRQVGARLVPSPPRFEATPFDDPKKGTLDEERRGPFPIGVALEAPIPPEWNDARDQVPAQRTAAAALLSLDGGLTANLVTAASLLEKDRRTLGLIPQTSPKTARLAVIGSGGVFIGEELSPAHEQLLLHTCNWLLKRDDRLPRTDESWSYPRTELSLSSQFYWQWGPLVGLPAIFLYVGVMVLMIRRVR